MNALCGRMCRTSHIRLSEDIHLMAAQALCACIYCLWQQLTCAIALQEDLCLMKVAEDGALRFVSGAVLFPQRWSLAEKLGMDMR